MTLRVHNTRHFERSKPTSLFFRFIPTCPGEGESVGLCREKSLFDVDFEGRVLNMDAMSIFVSFRAPLTLCALRVLRALCVTLAFFFFSLLPPRSQRLCVRLSFGVLR